MEVNIFISCMVMCAAVAAIVWYVAHYEVTDLATGDLPNHHRSTSAPELESPGVRNTPEPKLESPGVQNTPAPMAHVGGFSRCRKKYTSRFYHLVIPVWRYIYTIYYKRLRRLFVRK